LCPYNEHNESSSIIHRLHFVLLLQVRPRNFDAAAVLKKKKHFAGFMYRNCGFFLDSIVRTFFFALLSREYKKVLPMSDCMSTHRTPAEAASLQSIAADAHASFNGRSETRPCTTKLPPPHTYHSCSRDLCSPSQGDFYVGMDEAAALFQPFKFAFAMDNSALQGALSEKLANAYFGQSIPMFYGGVDIPDALNQKVVLHRACADCVSGRVVRVVYAVWYG
jgi:hypothetical protein